MVALLMFAAGCAFGLFFGWLLHRERVERALYEDVVRTRDRATSTLAETSARLELANKDMVRLRGQLTNTQHLLREREATIAERGDAAPVDADGPAADEPIDSAADAATTPDEVRLLDDGDVLEDDRDEDDITEEVPLSAIEEAAQAADAAGGDEGDDDPDADVLTTPEPESDAGVEEAPVEREPTFDEQHLLVDPAADEVVVAAIGETVDEPRPGDDDVVAQDPVMGPGTGAPGEGVPDVEVVEVDDGAPGEGVPDVEVVEVDDGALGEAPAPADEDPVPVPVVDEETGEPVVDPVTGPTAADPDDAVSDIGAPLVLEPGDDDDGSPSPDRARVPESAPQDPAPTPEEPAPPSADPAPGAPVVSEPPSSAGTDENPPAPSGRGDVLKRISGIGPALERRLRAEGITTYRQLATLDDVAIAELEEHAPQLVTRMRTGDWMTQARRLHEETHGTPL